MTSLRSKRSRAGRSSFGKRTWRVRKRGLMVGLREGERDWSPEIGDMF